jgi:MoaA/NifB/PqqE/SkfB family radical SAM enzyme
MRLVNHPVLCNYYLTYRCNAKCGFCDIWEQPSPYATLENVKANLNDLKKLGVKVIDFTGGEPLLHRQLAEILSLAKHQGFITTITTNGLLYPKKAKSLAGLIDMLHFSLDSYDQEQHDSMRGVACYESVLNSIEIALELGERPDILFTVFPHNLDQIAPVYENITKPNKLVLILNPAFGYNEVDTGDTLSSRQRHELRSWRKKPLVYLNDAFISLIEDGGNHINNPICKAGSSTIVISPHNELISPCYHLNKDQFKLTGNLIDVYAREEVQNALSMEGKLPECEGCAINCYMQPSFAIELNKYFWKALPSTIKYNRMKGTWKRLLSNTTVS